MKMKWKMIISPKTALLVLLFAAMVMVVPVSATDTLLFSIEKLLSGRTLRTVT